MLLELIGVLETGGARASNVPANPRKTLTVPIGASLTLRVSVVETNGSQVQLDTNSLTWTLKKSPRDADKLLLKRGPAAPAAQCDFSMVPNDTKQALPGRYVYDVWYTDANGNRNAVVPLSPFELEFVATLPP
jgi:hypothetical protein